MQQDYFSTSPDAVLAASSAIKAATGSAPLSPVCWRNLPFFEPKCPPVVPPVGASKTAPTADASAVEASDAGGKERHCDSLRMCIVTTLNEGLRNGGGIGDILRKPSFGVGFCLSR